MFGIKADELMIIALIASPGVFGLLALAFGVFLLSRTRPGGKRETGATVGGILLLLTGLGIGACYGAIFLGGMNLH